MWKCPQNLCNRQVYWKEVADSAGPWLPPQPEQRPRHTGKPLCWEAFPLDSRVLELREKMPEILAPPLLPASQVSPVLPWNWGPASRAWLLSG